MAAAIGAIGGAVGGGSGASSLLDSIFGSNTNTTTTGHVESNTKAQSLSDQDIANLQALIAGLNGNSDQYTRANAIKDAQGFADNALKQLTEQGLPKILSAESAAGAYDSTSSKMMANDLTARTASDISANTTNVISQYANDAAQNNSVVAALYNVLKGSLTNTNTVTDSTSEENKNKEGLLTTLNPFQGIIPNPGAGKGGVFGGGKAG